MRTLFNDLQKETVKELIKLAREFGIRGRHRMRKRQLIDALVEAAERAEKEAYRANAVAGTVIAFRLPKTDRESL